MKIESVSRKYLSAAFKAILVIVLIVTGIQMFTKYQFEKKEVDSKRKELNSSLVNLRKDLSEKVSIIASSQIFIDFLRSGEVSRQKQLLDLQILITTLKDEVIEGFLLEDSQKNTIFSYGIISGESLKIKLCYLNNSLNNEYGRCIGFLQLSFSSALLISELNEMNQNIHECLSCLPMYFDEGDSFGSFKQISGKSIPLNIQIEHNEDKSLFFLEIVSMLIILLVIFVLHKTFKSVSSEYIYMPIKELTHAISKGEAANLDSISVFEIRYLAENLNKYVEGVKEQENLKMKADLGDLARQVAHDIRSPLSVLEILINDNDKFHDKDKDVLNHALVSINSIANDLLKKSRSSSPPLLTSVSISLNSILREIVEEKKVLYRDKKNAQIEFIQSEDEIYLKIIGLDLKRVVSNLINNSVESLPLEAGIITVRNRIVGASAEITVSDNGIGVPFEVKKNLFNSTVTFGKNDGNGIGLKSAKETIEKYSGEISIESTLGTGTTIKISLPLGYS